MKQRRRKGSVFAIAPLAAVMLVAASAAAAAQGWPQPSFDAAHAGFNPSESTITTSTVSGVQQLWTAPTGGAYSTRSPAEVSGVVYIGNGPSLYAFNATTGSALWSAPTGGVDSTAPAVLNGVVFIAGNNNSNNGSLDAFDAAGSTNCSGTPKVCAPLWTAATGGFVASPTVVGGVVYLASGDGNLYAFDAAGSTNCSGTPKVCAPLWASPVEPYGPRSPAVANGVVYADSGPSLIAVDASTGAQLWRAPHDSPSSAAAVANGVVYVNSIQFSPYAAGILLAYDAAGTTNCSGTPKVCSPLWSALLDGTTQSTPAVANGVVFASAEIGKLDAFDAAGTTNCSGTPKVCSPLWTAPVPGGPNDSDPAVAGGVVYVDSILGSNSDNLIAFDAAGSVNCSGTPKVCSPLWSASTNNGTASPIVADGAIYLGSYSGNLYAFSLPEKNRVPQTITFTSTPPQGPIRGDTYSVSAVATDGLAVTFGIDASSAQICTITGTLVTFTGVGACVIDANQAGDAHYLPAPQATQTVTVAKTPQSITFTTAPPAYPGVGSVSYYLGATGGGSGNPVTFKADAASAGICTVSGRNVSFVGVGTCVVDANQAGNADYRPAPQAQQKFGVTPRTTTCAITGASPGPPAQQQVTVQSSAGLATIGDVQIVNGTVSVAHFTPGTTSPVVVSATKINQSKKTTWQFVATDSLGTRYPCL